jgi:dephospho-CoA kinase
MMNHGHKYRLIGLTGPNGAGKGEAAEILKAQGYDDFSLSDVIRDKLRAEGKTAGRDNMIEKGNELRREFGPDILARLIMDKVRGKAVIDSIRNVSEVEYLRARGGFVLIAVDAPAETRFERVRARGRDESAQTLEQFVRKEAEEKGEDAGAQQLDRVMAMADIILANDGSLEDLRRKLEEVL